MDYRFAPRFICFQNITHIKPSGFQTFFIEVSRHYFGRDDFTDGNNLIINIIVSIVGFIFQNPFYLYECIVHMSIYVIVFIKKHIHDSVVIRLDFIQNIERFSIALKIRSHDFFKSIGRFAHC